MKGLDISSLKEEKPERVIELWQRTELPHRPLGRDSPRSLQEQFRLNPDLSLGAYVEGRLVGTVLATDDGRKGWINRLAVDPMYRRKGVGSELLRRAELALRKRGRDIVAALVEEWNEGSIAFFQARGYSDFRGIHYLTKRESEEV